ncbi:MAG: helix-turn-helix transcriptional regulator [Pirellulaceae bacterium]|nr:helix-turn-helix transcriptional regulator [Pirellulaceae bacterium]
MTRRGFAIDGEKLLALYRLRGWSQQDLADQARLDVRTVAKLRRGGTCDASTLRVLSHTLDVKPEVLLKEMEAPPAQSTSQNTHALTTSSQSDLRIEQAWKIIDLRSPYRFGDIPSGFLLERYRVVRTGVHPTSIVLPYLTWGEGIECHDKPPTASWNSIAPVPGDIVHSDKQWELVIPLTDGPSGSEFEFGPIQLRFLGAFHGQDQQWWQTRTAYDIDCLTIQILFAPALPCKTIVASWAPPGQRKFVTLPNNTPFVLPDGTMASWQISNPQLGAFYKLAWTW